VVDVLRFTTAVSVAVGRGATVLPYRWHDEQEAAYAAQHGAELLGSAGLSPTAMARLESGARVVVPSPNGSALSFGVAEHNAEAAVLAGCLRNAQAVAEAVLARAGPAAVIAAGERWRGRAPGSGPLRPALEDLLGAGAVIDSLGAARSLSPEAVAARAAFRDAREALDDVLLASASGRELLDKGLGQDVVMAAAFDADGVAPSLVGPAFVGE
jgi:2-phosphosulfolactate phosphatase